MRERKGERKRRNNRMVLKLLIEQERKIEWNVMMPKNRYA